VAVRVLIVEDQPIFAETLRLFLDRDERIEIVGVATNGADGIDLAARNRADVVLMDIAMPGMDGIEATRRLLEVDPAARVLVLSGLDPDGVRDEVRRAGAVGLILKGSVAHELVDEILAAAAPAGGLH
jgi:two-component system, NarL family, response regulator LiaR